MRFFLKKITEQINNSDCSGTVCTWKTDDWLETGFTIFKQIKPWKFLFKGKASQGGGDIYYLFFFGFLEY